MNLSALYAYFIDLGSFFSFHVISTLLERLIIFAIAVVSLYIVSRRLAVMENKKLIALLFAGSITLLTGIFLISPILRYFFPLFMVLMLTLFLLIKRLPFTKRKKLLSTVVAGLVAISINTNFLSDFHRFIFPDKAVTMFAKGDLNSLALDLDNHVLYAAKQNENHILAFDISALDTSVKLSEAETGFSRTFTYDNRLKEIYNYNRIKQQLDVIDSPTLAIKESIPVSFPSGVKFDTWIGTDQRTGYIIIAAMPRGKRIEKPTLIVDRRDGRIIKRLSFDPMNILMNPTKPLFYMSWWQYDSNEFVSYDVASLEISSKTLIKDRMDRMVVWESANEVLLTVPLKATIYRLDADTLAIKGTIKSSLGVRTLAVDAERNLLLALSLGTGVMDVIDLRTFEIVNTYYLSPWLRSVVLDGKGTAYVSSFGRLFKVQYD